MPRLQPDRTQAISAGLAAVKRQGDSPNLGTAQARQYITGATAILR
jgi:hypothetical protein